MRDACRFRRWLDGRQELPTCRWVTYHGDMEMRSASYFIFAALIDRPLHGYAIVGRAAELSGGEVRPSTGTLYAVLERGLADGLVVAGEPYVAGGRMRRDYTLTPAGREALEAETQRMARAARTVTRRLGATAAAVAR